MVTIINTMNFLSILKEHRTLAATERDKGYRFEKLMRGFLKTAPEYIHLFQDVWLWNEFPYRKQFGGADVGIDLVARTTENEYWAVQCKCFAESTTISKDMVDTFLSTSSRTFQTEEGETIGFSHRLWISTSDRWGKFADEAFDNQNPPVSRLNLAFLENAEVDWIALNKGIFGEEARNKKFNLRPDQEEARDTVHEYFKEKDRGKLIMACGTGKTFVALKIAENEAVENRLVLVLVPSIALVGQTLGTWMAQADVPIHPICICSDSTVSKKKKDDDRNIDSVKDLALSASTNVKTISRNIQKAMRSDDGGLTVVFSTYQSIDVISQVQKEFDFVFDLVICDEAHRTTGVTLSGEDESYFVKVHKNENINAKRRLYMTATPRLYTEGAKKKADEGGAILCSMDDESIYGEEIYRLGFADAVSLDLLSDYKVLVLTLSEDMITPSIQDMISSNSKEIDIDGATKLIGCVNALSKLITGDDGVTKIVDPEPMKRAVAFCSSIKISKEIAEYFNTIPKAYLADLSEEQRARRTTISAEHVDGSMQAVEREAKLLKLKEDHAGCHIVTNVRCLSEGVDVPSLDAVIFMSPKNSEIDVVQSVGRVMRKAPGKKYGYIIIPVVIPAGIEPEKALDDNERFKVVWRVLNALRAHDERLGANIEKIALSKSKKRPDSPIIIDDGTGGNGEDWDGDSDGEKGVQTQLRLQYEELQGAVFARMVKKVGDSQYWEHWAKKVADIAETHKARLRKLVNNPDVIETFTEFVEGLKENINESIDEEQALEMLSQHMITKPIFEALFDNYSFTANNPVSESMQKMVQLLEDNAFDKETRELNEFYKSVKLSVEKTDDPAVRQSIIIKLYDNFFKLAFKKVQEQLGIVYTPVEVVDFIIHSVDDVLRKEFGRGLTDENVNILDPFTGTGTFIVRLLQSGLIRPEDLDRKYSSEIFANEIVLLAYYIAAVNIENAYHSQKPSDTAYKPFNGICLTDTFQINEFNEKEHLAAEYFPKNNERVNRQKKTPITVIMSNPPYSAGQNSVNDNAQNMNYPMLKKRIVDTYVKDSSSGNQNSVYDSYINAFRWATDRLTKEGIICFVSNGGWLDGNAMDGFRKHLESDFSSIYVFNLRGNQRTSGELSRKEGGKIFGSGSRTPVTITLLVKKPMSNNQKAIIHYHDIGDYLSREEKLTILKDFGSVSNPDMKWSILYPNKEGDWINARNPMFGKFICIGDKKGGEENTSFFVPYYSRGVGTSRDPWCYNYNKSIINSNIEKTIGYYNDQVDLFKAAKMKNQHIKVESFLSFDSTKFIWVKKSKDHLVAGTKYNIDSGEIVQALYRPFVKMNLYFSPQLNNEGYNNFKRYFPNSQSNNKIISVAGIGNSKEHSAIITDVIADVQLEMNGQCFPLYYYEENTKKTERSLKSTQRTLSDNPEETPEKTAESYTRKDGVSDFILNKARTQYNDTAITKEDIFYYVYGFLHSKEYRETFTSDLKKMLARIPLVKSKEDFFTFSKAGRKLADLHLNYETVAPYSGVDVSGAEFENFRVTQMRFAKVKNDAGKTVADKSKIVFNESITILNVPKKAYEYVVNGKSAIEWIMERYCVSKDKDSGIVNDANDWADEVGNPRYILDLLLSIINVSVQTVDIVNSLPKVTFEEEK